MLQVTIEFPDEVIANTAQSPEEFVHEMRLAAAIHWYQFGQISQGKAAKIAGLSRSDFLAVLAKKKIDVFEVDFDDLQQELERGTATSS